MLVRSDGEPFFCGRYLRGNVINRDVTCTRGELTENSILCFCIPLTWKAARRSSACSHIFFLPSSFFSPLGSRKVYTGPLFPTLSSMKDCVFAICYHNYCRIPGHKERAGKIPLTSLISASFNMTSSSLKICQNKKTLCAMRIPT